MAGLLVHMRYINRIEANSHKPVRGDLVLGEDGGLSVKTMMLTLSSSGGLCKKTADGVIPLKYGTDID